MHALLRFGLLAGMIFCCQAMIRYSLFADEARLRRAQVWMRGICYVNGALCALWLINLLRHISF